MQKYKVFFNEKSILFSSFGKITLSRVSAAFSDFSDAAAVKNWLDEFENSDQKEAVFQVDESLAVLSNFSRSLLPLPAAGGVVRKNGKILCIFRNGKWDLPKGKIENGETEEQAALREVEEECGIQDLSISKTLPATYHIYRSPYKETRGQWVFKKTAWFEMEYAGNGAGTPQTEEGISALRWFAPAELDDVLQNTYANLRDLIAPYRD